MIQLTEDKYYSKMSLDVEDLENPARDLENKEVLEVFKAWFPQFSFSFRTALLGSFRVLSQDINESVRKDFLRVKRQIFEN